VTQAEKERLKLLASGLHFFGMEEQDIVITLGMVCSNPKQVEALIQWLATHEGATTAEISDAVVEIVQTVK
jgi:hypothetical protein